MFWGHSMSQSSSSLASSTHRHGSCRAVAYGVMLLLVFGTASVKAQVAPLVLELPVDSVTVYPRTAIVTRLGEVDVPAGSTTLMIENLPMGLDPARLQLSIADSSVQFDTLRIEESHQGQATNAQENELRDRLQALDDDRQVILDRIETAQSELRLLESLGQSGEAGVRPTIDGAGLAELINVMSDSSARARERIRNASVELRNLDRQIEQLRFDLEQVATQQSVSSRLRVSLRSEAAVSTVISVAYPQNNASWSWLYEARLDTAAPSLSLLRQAAVVQGSGEDWNDVLLTLSTSTPHINTTTPELGPLFVDISRPRFTRNAADSIEEVTVTGSMIRGASAAFEAPTVMDTGYQVDYLIPGRVSVAADRQQQVVPVDRSTLDVKLVSRTVPSLDARAYLEARFEFDEETPLQSGRMQLYRDGAYIGFFNSPPFLPGQSVRLAFGVDQRIEVRRFDEQQESRDAGVFRRSDVREERIRYELVSRHPEAVTLEVLDRIPVSRHADISVSIPRQATAADETDVEGQSGLLLWRLQLAPQQTASIRHYYDIRHPQDIDISLQ